MAQAQMRDTAGGVVSSLELNDAVFGVARNDTLIHQAVLRIQANRRRGTHDTKTRGEVSGTTAKWYRQKGTGRARHGAQTAPQFRKGGVVFGPHPRSYKQAMPQKMRRKALCSVLSHKLVEGRVHVVDAFNFAAPRTKEMIAVLKALGVERRVLIVLPQVDANVSKSAHNIPRVRTTVAHTLNVLDAIESDHLVFTQEALRSLEGLLTGQQIVVQPLSASTTAAADDRPITESAAADDSSRPVAQSAAADDSSGAEDEPTAVNGESNGTI